MSQPNKSQSAFNPNEDYSTTLQNMTREFEERWNQPTPSPSSNLQNYEQRGVLGHGSFGTVLLVKEKKGKNYFAAKMMSKDLLVAHKQVQHVHNEKHVLSATRFPFLIHLVDSSKDNDYLYLILPVVSGGELFTYLRRVRKFNEKQARFYGAQVVLALEYLHQMHLIYRDLKPENILLDMRGYIKLTDFGFAKRVDGRTSTLCGTPEYLAPEIVQLRPYNKSVDWWALGILIYEFVAGHSPFSDYSHDVLLMYNRICNKDYKMPHFFTNMLKSLVDDFLQVEFSRRLGNSNEGAIDVKTHPWFQGIEWFAMLNQEVPPPYKPTISGDEDLSNFQNFRMEEKLKSKNNRHPELFAKF
ncbi:cAMP-dependent protein kinase catalytic subunit 2-like isoform X1 [Drosophila kikkawai]|uniref:cAMP-dependent protein kinase catalytic subunit 2-like isoform X1 n=2 Tax=Drosophila kikkawai TaxID=30033 RepID=A0A6P4IEM3_DROKI|nr:cAMP-dependent protein kinase catalytic subunit 2-like isoform X1 [Drosophila kikkawai]